MKPSTNYAVLKHMESPPLEYLVDETVPQGSAGIFAAREKAGKGFIALHLAASVALGEPFLGKSVSQGPALYIALEESPRVVRDRAVALLGDNEDAPLYFAIADGDESGPFQLNNIESIGWLRTEIVDKKLKLVILDVLREAHDGRENESDDMAELIRPIRQIAHEHNTTIIVTHHSSKVGGPRGSTAITAAFDSVYTFIRDEQEDDTEMRGLFVGKGRELPKFAQRIEFNQDTHRWRAIEGAPLHSQATNIREKILQVINATDAWLTAEDIAAKIPDTKLQTVRNKLSDMVGEHYRQILVEGTGTKGDPRRYHGIHKREQIDADTSGNNPGTKEESHGPVCIQCGIGISEGQRYCPSHGGFAEDVNTGNPAWDELWEAAS